MKDLSSTISVLLIRGNSIALIACSDAGKTYWVKNELIPALKRSKKIAYFKDGNSIANKIADIYIFDEAETLSDRKFLEGRHLDESPYYSQKYLKQVESWHKFYKKFASPSLYVISRNSEEEINYLVRNFVKTDWDGRKIKSIKFVR